MMIVSVMMTQFVMHHTPAILKRVHHVVLRKQSQHAEDTRLIEVEHTTFQVFQTHRVNGILQLAVNQYPVDGRFHAFMLQMGYHFLTIHTWFRRVCCFM